MATTEHGGAATDESKVRSSSSVTLKLLSVFLFCLLAIPSRLVFGPLGAAGTPAGMLCVGFLGLWTFKTLAAYQPRPRMQPTQIGMLLFLGAVMASFVAGTIRPIDSFELRGADRSLLTACGWLGLLFMASELRRRSELDTLLRRLVFGGGLVASLGVVQFITGQSFTNYIVIPGLRLNDALGQVGTRAGFNRPAGTATHPIEFGAVLTIVLPIALHYALSDVHRPRLRRWFPVVVISVTILVSISRSALVSGAVGMLVLLPGWEPTIRRRAYVAITLLLGSAYLFVPGLLGTLTGLFTNISNDGSAASRTESYALAFQFISRAPFFGRGWGTFAVSYRILDNQYLGLLIEIGFVGVAAFLGLILSAIASTVGVRRRSTDPATRSLAHSLTASVAATALSLAFYDSFAFPMSTSLAFLVLGCTAALRRVAGYEVAPITQVGRSGQPLPPRLG